ncbi:hypothetical protein [Spiroplasma endosymbiont of Zeiraphera isertana]|uniref:hypothetical protein n=1 Tax=Spiroplasma endosymbiont of Zeiraphera isertana TaxID=3066313 RepID=UPI00313EF617
MENYEIVKQLLKIKEPLEVNYLEKYYQNTIKTKETILDLEKLNHEINQYKKIKAFLPLCTIFNFIT